MTWNELVGTALLGTERRGGEPEALLARAAAETVRRRAGLRPASAGPRPAPAPVDQRPALPEAARRRLALLLADRKGGGASGAGGRRSAEPNVGELLPQWLAAANARGYAAPPALLPALLDAARARTDIRTEALTLAGARALWLAELNTDWRFALRTGGGGAPGADPDLGKWEEGLFAERIAVLTRLRTGDPERGLALLRTTWASERAEDRLMFVDALRDGLTPADEPFLEQALSDRSRNVRATAAELLSALPGSALAARMAQRARSCVSLDLSTDRGGRTDSGPRILVEAPYACDAAMERDGIVPVPPAGRGERAWWFGQLVDATPLATWRERFGGRTAEEVVGLPVADSWQSDLHAAWCRAAVRQRDAEWARALLGQTPVGDPAKLLSVLPERERADRVAAFVASHGLSEAFQMLAVCAVPWAEPLGGAVIDALDIARDAGSYPWSFSGVMGLAERCLDPAVADRATPLTAVADEPADATPGAAAYWAEAFQRLVGTLRLRAAMLAELA